MSTNGLLPDAGSQGVAVAERDKQKLTVKKVADVVKGVAVTYVGFQLGLFALRFIGRRLRRKPEPAPQRTRSLRAQPSAAAASVHAAAASEDFWAPIDAAPPETPEGYKPIVSATLPCTPHELYSILFSGSGTDLYLKQHREIGKQWDLVATGWRRAPAAAAAAAAAAAGGADAAMAADGSLLGSKTVFEYVVGQPGSGGFTRLLTFWNPKKPPSTVDTRCVQRQQLCIYRGGQVVFATAMNMLDIPFKDCFTVNTFWRVLPGPTPGTSLLTINLKVNFIKRAMGVGGIISATTFRDSAAFFTAFIANVDTHIGGLREQAGAPLPAPLPTSALPGATSARAGRVPSLAAARSPMVSPFAAAAAAGGPAQSAGGAAPSLAVQQPAPAWKQVRALAVILVITFTLLNQIHLAHQIATLRGDAGGVGPGADAAAGSGSGGEGGAAGVARNLLAAALGPVVTAAGGLHLALQGLVDRVGGRAL